MADKIFIGKVSEKTFNNGGSIIKLSLNADDLKKLSQPTTIEIKKSSKGNWYAEISNYQQPAQQPQRSNYVTPQSEDDDLPF
jgi:hypothetical protein